MSHGRAGRTATSDDDIERLLAERDWVRRVARALVSDENSADDLEQELWLRVLGREAPRSPRAWLATVVRRLASNLRRSQSRRSSKEREAPATRAPPAPPTLAARRETRERVARAVAALPEPGRTAVLLRYYEDLPPRAIAERLGVPLETVRARLRRARAMLRERLDRELGERRHERVPVLASFLRRWSPAPAGPPLMGAAVGGLVVTAKTKASAAMVAVILLLLGATSWSVWHSEPLHPDRGPTRPALGSSAPRAVPTARRGQKDRPRESVAADDGGVLVRDAEGRPVAGAVVACVGLPGGGGTHGGGAPVPIGSTNPAGRVAWPDREISFPCVVRASSRRYGIGDGLATSRKELSVVRLHGAVVVHGLVVSRSGHPIAGASVVVTAVPASNALGCVIGTTGSWMREGRTDTRGRFAISGLPPPAFGAVAVRAEGFVATSVPLPPWGDSLKIVLDRPFSASVHVEDSSGAPVDGARVYAFGGPSYLAGASGTSSVVSLLPAIGRGDYGRSDLPAGWYSLLVARSGFALKVRDNVPFSPGFPAVRVTLHESTGLDGRVLWADTKEPVVGARIRAVPLRDVPSAAGDSESRGLLALMSQMDGPFAAVTDAEGRYHLSVFGPSSGLRVEALGPDGERASAEHPGKGGTATIPDIDLPRLHRVDYTGRIVTLAGKPISNAIVRGLTREARTVSGPEGRFRLVSQLEDPCVDVLAEGFVTRVVSAPGTSSGIVAPGTGFGSQDFGDVRLAPLRRIRGIVVDRDGTPVPGARVFASPTAPMNLPKGSSFGSSGVSGPSGRVTLLAVPGHQYRVTSYPRSGSVDVSGDETGAFRLVVGADPHAGSGRIVGRLRYTGGTWMPTRVWLSATGGDGKPPSPSQVGPDGTFELPSVPAGTWKLEVVGTAGVAGELSGVRVSSGGTVRVDVECRSLGSKGGDAGSGGAVAEVRVRLGGQAASTEGTRAWSTTSSGLSTPLTSSGDGTLRGTAPSGATTEVWVSDIENDLAGLTRHTPDGTDETARVDMVAGGRVLLPGREHGTKPPRVDVRDERGDLIFSGFEDTLPASSDPPRYFLLLPPGTYRVSITEVPPDGSLREYTANVVAGERAELR